jgi:hypothetical protein
MWQMARVGTAMRSRHSDSFLRSCLAGGRHCFGVRAKLSHWTRSQTVIAGPVTLRWSSCLRADLRPSHRAWTRASPARAQSTRSRRVEWRLVRACNRWHVPTRSGPSSRPVVPATLLAVLPCHVVATGGRASAHAARNRSASGARAAHFVRHCSRKDLCTGQTRRLAGRD